jgi:hypothetical protein
VRPRDGDGGGAVVSAQPVTSITKGAECDVSGEVHLNQRRIVASFNGSNLPVSGSRPIPSAAITCGGASATNSPIAANDLAPASTAATDAIRRDVSECRIPLGRRGSGTAARHEVQGRVRQRNLLRASIDQGQ